MPSVLSKTAAILSPGRTAAFSSVFILVYFLRKFRASRRLKAQDDLHIKLSTSKTSERAAVDGAFFKQLFALLKILIPKIFCPEMGYMLLVASSLILRTYCDVWMIENGTAIESCIIGADRAGFLRHLFKFIMAMPSISLINNFLKYGLSELKLHFRTNLSKYLYDKYLSKFTYYQMSNLDNRIANADQLLTQDVEKFCDCIADLYSNLSKPILDIVIYAISLTSTIGARGPGFMLLYLVISGLFLTRLRRPIGKMTMIEQQYEGEYRYVNSRLITNSEEIAFYQGNIKEASTIRMTFQKLVNHLRYLISFRFGMGLVDNIIAKYVATVVGYSVVSRPFLDASNPKLAGRSHSHRLEEYYKTGRMLVRMAEAIGRVVLAGREMTRLAGFTARIVQLNRVLNDLNKNKYERTMVSSGTEEARSHNDSSDYEVVNEDEASKGPKKKPIMSLVPGSGRIIIQNNIIKFDQVPLITPNGDVLVEELNFVVNSGTNVIICGPNGCGKSSLFRILGGLWPLFGGTLTKPPQSKLFYVPQRPYMTLGTLRDQITYPDTHNLMKSKGIKDEDLFTYLEKVQLSYILDREGGWDSVQDWMDVLSGGEKQRIAMARLFYHKPQFAILDECTSAVSVDVEGTIYKYCREVGISLFTVSHRKSLWKHHEYYLHMDGRGSFTFNPITEETEEFGS